MATSNPYYQKTDGIHNRYDLDTYHDRCQQLYITENKTLKEIIRILREEGCLATENMYQRKFRAWGFKKNKKWSANGPYEQQINTSSGDNNQRISTPTVYTAPVFKVFKQPDILDGPEKFLQALSNTQSCFTSQQLNEGIALPLHQQEILHYYFNPQINHGIALMREGRYRTGGALIKQGLELTSIVLNRRDPHLLYVICYHVFHMGLGKLHGLAEIYTRYIHQVSYNILGQNHQFTGLTKLLYQNRDSWAIGEGTRAIYEATQAVAGPSLMMTLSAYKFFIGYLVKSSAPFEEVCHHFESLIQRYERYGQHRWRGVLGSQGDYAAYLTSNNQISRALNIYQQACSTLFENPPPDRELAQILVPICVQWADAIMKEPIAEKYDTSYNKRYRAAEMVMQNTIEKAILVLGPNDPETIFACETLAKFYTQYGSPEKSQVQLDFVRDQIADLNLDDESSQS